MGDFAMPNFMHDFMVTQLSYETLLFDEQPQPW
jgi:hypothetical protein